MNKYFLAVLLSFSVATPALCGVRSVVSETGSNRGYTISVTSTTPQTEARCIAEGYKTTSCSGGKVPRLPCPYSGEYYGGCCEAKFNYTKAYCYEQDMKPSDNNCQGFYYCIDKEQH